MFPRITTEMIDGEHTEVHEIDGKRFQLLGYVMKAGERTCPTDLCGSYCCKSGTVFPDQPPPCSLLSSSGLCSMQVRGGIGAKPYGCVVYPRSQSDIDHMNRNAVGEHRCHLRFEEI